MSRLVWALLAIVFALMFFWWVGTGFLFSDVERKGDASEITEWVKLAVALVSLAIGVVNLRIALSKERTK